MFEIGKATHAGVKRKDHPNQDSIGLVTPGFFNRKPALLIVADGMGGYEGGAIASQMVVEILTQIYTHNKKQDDYRALLSDMILNAHEAVKERVADDPEIARMGSTVVAVILDENRVYVGNVGDSRAYIINAGEVKQISLDHSFVGELVRQGVISQEQSLIHPKRNILTMSITAQREDIEPYVGVYDISAGDNVLLCSDGLWGVVSIEDIKATVLTYAPQEAAERLIEMANNNFGPDNISVIIARKK